MSLPDNLTKVRELLREGNPQEADRLLGNMIADPAIVPTAAPATRVEPPPPRSAYAITLDLFTEIVAHLGNQTVLEQLLEELKAAKD